MTGAGMYYYVIDEYRVSNQLLTEDIYVRPSHPYTHLKPCLHISCDSRARLQEREGQCKS
jgi:hypothetical protein